ncbi:hypothetical protein VSR34_24020, partial [Paraburkholderia sp. JHI2823]|uniref:hypothetical protein n=1 Tax=Paraburkholderia sp. JHI2823 TaxID=3112960 RepID=UPI00317FA4AE
PTSWSPNSTRTDKEIYNRHRATPNPAESVTFPKSAVTFAEIRTVGTYLRQGYSTSALIHVAVSVPRSV